LFSTLQDTATQDEMWRLAILVEADSTLLDKSTWNANICLSDGVATAFDAALSKQLKLWLHVK